MTGWRIGFAGAPAPSDRGDGQAAGPEHRNASSVSQAAALAALNGPQDSVEAMRQAYARRRDMVVPLLNQASGLRCHTPDGAFYVFPDMRACLGKTSAGGTTIDDRRATSSPRCWRSTESPSCRDRPSSAPGISASASPRTTKRCARPACASGASAPTCIDREQRRHAGHHAERDSTRSRWRSTGTG